MWSLQDEEINGRISIQDIHVEGRKIYFENEIRLQCLLKLSGTFHLEEVICTWICGVERIALELLCQEQYS